MKRLGAPAALALALALGASSACGARAPAAAGPETLSVPFDGMRAQENPSAPYLALHERLRREAAEQARGDGHEPVVLTQAAGMDGAKTLIGAVTPVRGVFYLAETGPYRPDGTVAAAPRDRAEVCRFTVTWAESPGGAYVPGMVWAGHGFPDLDCRALPEERTSGPAAWRRTSERASYAVGPRGAAAGLSGAIVTESWPGLGAARPRQPFDGARAVSALAGSADAVLRAVPADGHGSFFVETRSGRTFLGLFGSAGTGGGSACLVEGLGWADVAAAQPLRKRAAEALCVGLQREYGLSLTPAPHQPQPRVAD